MDEYIECPASKPEYRKREERKINTNTRLTGASSIKDIAIKMSDGNPGALTVIMQLLQNPADIGFIFSCDGIGLYGSQLYMLWNDCCERDMSRFKTVLKAWQCGKVTTEEILQHVSGGYGAPFDGLNDED